MPTNLDTYYMSQESPLVFEPMPPPAFTDEMIERATASMEYGVAMSRQREEQPEPDYEGAYDIPSGTIRPSSTVRMSPYSNWGTYERFMSGNPSEAVPLPLPKKKKSMSDPESYHCNIQERKDMKGGYWELTISYDKELLYEEVFSSMTELDFKFREVIGHLIKTGKTLEEGGL